MFEPFTRTLLALLLTIASLSSLQASANPTQTAQQALFGGKTPEDFTVLRGGELAHVARDHHQGHFLLLQNTSKKLMALVVKSKAFTTELEAQPVLEKENLAVVASYLFDEYVGLKRYEITNERDRWVELDNSRTLTFPANWLRVKFEDKFEESDFIAKLAYPDGSQVIILLGAPATGNYKNCAAFRDDYFRMERAAKEIANTGGLVTGAITPTTQPNRWKTYLKNLPKSHHRKHCLGKPKAVP